MGKKKKIKDPDIENIQLDFPEIEKLLDDSELLQFEKTVNDYIKVMDVNFAGVDVTISKDLKVYVIELNAFPGFTKVRRFNLSKRIIQHMEDRKWN